VVQTPEIKRRHPVERDDFEINTPAIKALRSKLGFCMDAGIAGLVVQAPSRCGKSRASNYFMKKKLPNQNIPIVSMRMPRDISLSENQFYERMLQKFGHGDPYSGTARKKNDRLVKYLYMLAQETGTERIYLFIDDAHELEESQFSFLCNIYDELFDDKKVQPCFVLLSEPKIQGRIDGMRGRGKTQIIARLLSKTHHFAPVRDAETVTKILAGYDEDSEFPPGSGCAFAQYYYPEAYETGWRLASQGELLFQAFKKAHEKSGVTWPFLIPMESLMRAVKYALVAYRNQEATFKSYTFIQLEKAVEYSSYINASSYLDPPKKRKTARA
jgi:hypothetical protein